MFRRDERELAARLARVLDGQEPGEGELASLATVLERAAEPARVEITEGEIEHALGDARCRLPARRSAFRVPRIGLAFGAAAAAALAVLVVTLTRLPSVDVEGKALAALGGRDTVLKIYERIEPVVPGTFPPSTRSVWLDPNLSRSQWTHNVHGLPVEITLVDHGRVSRYLPERNVVIVGSSCRAFASGCADVIDPVAFYRNALLRGGAIRARKEERGGREVYVLTLPVQTLPDAVRIQQRVTIGAKSFLPRSIEWQEQLESGRMRTVARIAIEDIDRMTQDDAVDAFTLPLPIGVRIIQRTAPGVHVRKLGERRLTVTAAQGLVPPLLWLGKSFGGRPLQRIDEVRWNAGTAYRLRYRGITVWNYSQVIPPELVAGRIGAPSKPLPGRRGVAHFYEAGGKLVTELDMGKRSVAVVAPELYKEDIFRLIESLRPLR